MKKGLGIFLIIVLAVILIVLILQLVAMNNQNKILEDSSIPIYSEVKVFPSGRSLFSYNSLINQNPQYIEKVGVLNLGNSRIPYLNISMGESEYFEPYSLRESYKVTNLTSMESNTIQGNLRFKLKLDAIDSFESGIYPLKFRIYCPICRERISYPSYDICVYKISPEIDCGPEWKDIFS